MVLLPSLLQPRKTLGACESFLSRDSVANHLILQWSQASHVLALDDPASGPTPLSRPASSHQPEPGVGLHVDLAPRLLLFVLLPELLH
eukprot:Skav235725  [mRNA]  locus=scaffold280:738508:742453:- [translate_table: standard]